jgi:hypothetical protein
LEPWACLDRPAFEFAGRRFESSRARQRFRQNGEEADADERRRNRAMRKLCGCCVVGFAQRRISGTPDAPAVSERDNGSEARRTIMSESITPSQRHRFSLPKEPARRAATQSLLMVAGTAVATVIAWIIGTFLQSVVFDLGEQELLSEAGAWGYVAAILLLVLMVLPGILGMALGVRARRLGEHRLGTTGIVVNAVIAAYLVFTVAANLVFG